MFQIAMASRIPGVTPTAVAHLLRYVKQQPYRTAAVQQTERS